MKSNTDILSETIERLRSVRELSALVVLLRKLKAQEVRGESNLPPLKSVDELMELEKPFSMLLQYTCMLIDRHTEGIGIKTLYEKLHPIISSNLFDRLISNIKCKNCYCFDEEWIYKDRPRICDSLKNLPDSIAKKVFSKKLLGQSNLDIAKFFNITVAKVNEYIADMLLELTSQGQTYYEDRYAMLFESYLVTPKLLNDVFSEHENTWIYLTLRYNPGAAPLKSAIKNDQLSPNTRKKIKQYLDNDKIERETLKNSQEKDTIKSIEKNCPAWDKRVYKRLNKRIDKYFDRKFYIGDITVSEQEYELLIYYLREKLRYICMENEPLDDCPLLAIALVQIGIRCYNGAYWSHVTKLVGTAVNGREQYLLGQSFINTMRRHGKYIVSDSERVSAILFHGFVSNYYSKGLFEFLFQYFTRDLERDINRNDRDQMKALMDTLTLTAEKSSEEIDAYTDIFMYKCGSRAYKLRHHTLQAIEANPMHSSMRLRRILRLMDDAFWNDSVPKNPSSRLTILFKEWVAESPSFNEDYKLYKSGEIRNRGKKHFSAPYLYADIPGGSFKLKLPPQIVSAEYANNLSWNIELRSGKFSVKAESYQVLTGFKTEEAEIEIYPEDLFAPISCRLMCGKINIKASFTIPASKVRFFDMEGDFAQRLFKVPMCAFTEPEDKLSSPALMDSLSYGGIRRWDFEFQQGDIVVLPDKSSMVVGERYTDGLVPRGQVRGSWYSGDDGEKINVYSKPPVLMLTIDKDKIPGTALYLNDVKYRLSDCEYTDFESADSRQCRAFILSLEQFKECRNLELNKLIVDIPGSVYAKAYPFVYAKDYATEFVDSPYIFEERACVVFPPHIKATCSNAEVTKLSGENGFMFELSPELSSLNLRLWDKIDINVDIPMLMWSGDKVNWHIEPMNEIWHSDFFSYKELYFRAPSSKIQLYTEMDILDDDDEGEMRTVEAESCGDGLYRIDMTRFRSWIKRNKLRHEVLLKFGSNEYNFATVYARSYVMTPYEFSADCEEEILSCSFDIIGKSDYYIDITETKTNLKLAQKRKLEDGRFTMQGYIPNGTCTYKIEIFEAEEDDSGFDDLVYYTIFTDTKALINNADMSGKYLHIRKIKRANSGLLDDFHEDYWISEFHKVAAFTYEGRLIKNGTLSDDRVEVYFPFKDNLRYFYLKFWDDYEEDFIEYILDRNTMSLVKEEDASLRPSVKYNRYRVLYDPDYEFFGSPEDFLPNTEN